MKEVRPLTKQDEFTMALFENLTEQIAETNRLLGILLSLQGYQHPTEEAPIETVESEPQSEPVVEVESTHDEPPETEQPKQTKSRKKE